MRIPSDYKILRDIYDHYYQKFTEFSKDSPDRAAKILVPIDVNAIAKRLKVDPDIVFGRLHYHLEPKYGYETDDGVRVVFFTLEAGKDRHCVNFPLLGSVLAGLAEQAWRDRSAMVLAIISLVISVIALVRG